MREGGIRSDDARATPVIEINTSESERYTFSVSYIKEEEKQSAFVSSCVTQRARGVSVPSAAASI